jgi:hypothetical protein
MKIIEKIEDLVFSNKKAQKPLSFWAFKILKDSKAEAN